MTIEVKASELKVGDVIVAKQGGRRFRIVSLMAGIYGWQFPYLTLTCDGKKLEHDTSLDSQTSTYTVIKGQS